MTPAFGSTSLSVLCALLAALASAPASAQYKVVGPDGKVTYTDRAPSNTDSRITSLGARAPVAAEAPLPLDLRQAVTRYPVTLYVATADCEPCEAARQLLRLRGVPYTEKQVMSSEDGDALERLSGGRDAPTLTIGSQTLRGLAPEVWASYLDAANYPRDSRLPANYQYPAATPLTERREAKAPAAQPRAAKPGGVDATAVPNPVPTPTPGAAGIKF